MNSERAETPQQQPQGNLASAGAQLKAQREALGWPVEQVAEAAGTISYELTCSITRRVRFVEA